MEQELTPQQKAGIEYDRRIIAREFIEPDTLKDKTRYDVMIMPEFAEELAACMNEQKQTRESVREVIAKMRKDGKKIVEQRPVIDRVIEAGLLDDAGEFAVAFVEVQDGESKHPKAIREYIRELGMKAFNNTIRRFINEANPDMKELYEQATATTKS